MRQLTPTQDSALTNTNYLAKDTVRTEDKQPRTETRAESARVDASRYESLDAAQTKVAFTELDHELNGLADTVIHTLDQTIPYLAKMQSLLSQRGSARKKVLKAAGLPSWTDWAVNFAAKFDSSLRTVQERIKLFRSERKSGGERPRPDKPFKLDARQQASLVRAQTVTNDLVSALKNGGDWQTPLAEYERVAVTPATLCSFMAALNPEPDWKIVLHQFVATLEQHHENLPVSVVAELRVVQGLLAPKPLTTESEEPVIAVDDEVTSADVSCPGEVERRVVPVEAQPDSTNVSRLTLVDVTGEVAHQTGEAAPTVKVTKIAPAYENEDGDSCERTLSDASGYHPAALAKQGYVLNQKGRLEFVGKDAEAA